MKRDTLLDLILTNKEGRDEKVKGSPSCNDQEIVELRILRDGNKTNSRIAT